MAAAADMALIHSRLENKEVFKPVFCCVLFIQSQ